MFRLAQDSVNEQVNVQHINLHHYNSISTLSVVRRVLRWLFNFAEPQGYQAGRAHYYWCRFSATAPGVDIAARPDIP